MFPGCSSVNLKLSLLCHPGVGKGTACRGLWDPLLDLFTLCHRCRILRTAHANQHVVRERQKHRLRLARDESFLAPDLRVLVEVVGARYGERFSYHKSAGGSLEAEQGHSTLNSRHRIWSLTWYCVLRYAGYMESKEADERNFCCRSPLPTVRNMEHIATWSTPL